MVEIRMAVWQFVRLMVALEARAKNPKIKGATRGAYAAWRGPWAEIDKRLSDLAKSDPDAFADLMMEQEVVLDCPSAAILDETVETARAVADQLHEELQELKRGDEKAAHFRDERDGLRELAHQMVLLHPEFP